MCIRDSFYGANALVGFTFLDDPIGVVGIALCHSVFNIFTTALLLPFSRQLEKLARRLVRSESRKENFAFLDPLLLRTPGVAISECVSMTNQMGALAHKSLLLSLEQLNGYSETREAQILENEDKLDIYEDRLGSYLVEISQHGVSMEDMLSLIHISSPPGPCPTTCRPWICVCASRWPLPPSWPAPWRPTPMSPR